jgi:ABC-type amino acid transport system permease subunit
MVRIILPQAVKNIIPAIGNEMVALLKETSIIGWVGSTPGEITFDLNAASNTIYRTIPNFLASGVIIGCCYLAIVYIMVFAISIIEKRLAKDGR